MKNPLSLFSILTISLILIGSRFSPVKYQKNSPLIVTTWDALGYYIYLPAIFIYHDFKELSWFPEIDKKYSVSGGKLYQAGKDKNGNTVFKYLGGVAILEAPIFFISHISAGLLGFPRDGFSPPYQMGVAFGAIFYCLLGIFFLRKILLRYYSDQVTAITILLLILASNVVQYISYDGAMSHSFIFFLYVLVLFATIKWHEKPSVIWAAIIGATIGLATISRPTEAIMVFIPLLWGTQTKQSKAEKWNLVKIHKNHLTILGLFGFLAILPQLIYWKLATGSFVYDVGSKWVFLNPYFRVLFGWEKGWFIYTPVAILFVLGLFFIKKFPFRYSVITFCLLNIYIVISWADWRYGASYSCRALVQSYPVFAFALGALIDRIFTSKWRYPFLLAGLYLIFLNLFQINQYNKTILHYDDMNRIYYGSIYLNANPSPLVMSLLDTDEKLNNEDNFKKVILINSREDAILKFPENSSKVIFENNLNMLPSNNSQKVSWIKINSTIKLNSTYLQNAFLQSELIAKDSIKMNHIRLINAISPQTGTNEYAFFVKVPLYFNKSDLKLSITSVSEFEGIIKKLSVEYLY